MQFACTMIRSGNRKCSNIFKIVTLSPQYYYMTTCASTLRFMKLNGLVDLPQLIITLAVIVWSMLRIQKKIIQIIKYLHFLTKIMSPWDEGLWNLHASFTSFYASSPNMIRFWRRYLTWISMHKIKEVR